MKKLLQLLGYSFIACTAFSYTGVAQITFSEDFESYEAYDNPWTDTTFWAGDETACEGDLALVTNLYFDVFWGFGTPVAETVTPLIGTSNGGEITLTYQYKLLNYGTLTAVENSDDWGMFTIAYSTSPTGPFTVVETVNTSNHEVSESCAERTVNFSPPAGADIYLKFYAEIDDYSNDFYVIIDDISITQDIPDACAGIPDASVTVAASPVICNSESASLSLSTAYNDAGITFQWQSSADGINFTDVASGGTGFAYTATQSESTWYQAIITCTNSTESVTSTPVLVTNSGLDCYCDITFEEDIEPITSVQFAGIDNETSATVNGTAGVENFTSVTPAEVTAGETYTITLEGNTNGNYETYFMVYIDFNHNGILDDDGESFEAGFVANSTGVDGAQTTADIEIPETAMEGLTYMRVLKLYDAYSTDPCSSEDGYGYGQAEDYLINVTAGVEEVLDYVNLQYPSTMELLTGETGTVYAQAWEGGVTEGPGAGAGVTAWIGINEENTDPATWDTWIEATYNTAVTGNNDEFMADIGAGLEPGTYYYASRFQLNDGPYTYGGYTSTGGGYWNGIDNISGVLTVTCGTEAPLAADTQYFCSGATIADLVTEDSSVIWYTDETGEDVLSSDISLLNGTTYYAANSPEGACESVLRTPVTVNITTLEAPAMDDVQDFCNSATVADLNAGTDVIWYTEETDGTAMDMSNALTDGGVYYAAAFDGDCESPVRTAVQVNINVLSAPTAITEQAFCGGATIADFETDSESVMWYMDATGDANLDEGHLLVDGMTYYVATVDGDCESEGRTAVTASVNTVAAPTGDALQTFENTMPMVVVFSDLDITATGTLNWYASEQDAIDGINGLDENYAISGTETFYVTQTIDGCESEPFAVTVEVLMGTEGFAAGSFVYYPNPVKDVLNLSYNATIDKAEVYNLIGQKVMEKAGAQAEMQLPMSQLSAGTYIVKVTSAGAATTIKVVKQ